MTALPNYSDCSHKRPVPILAISEDVAKSIGSDNRFLPLFEKSAYEYSFRKFYSLKTNEFLKCRWQSYIRSFDQRKFAPFNFIDIRATMDKFLSTESSSSRHLRLGLPRYRLQFKGTVLGREFGPLFVFSVGGDKQHMCPAQLYFTGQFSKDFHFCNSKNRLLPSESVHTRKDFRYKLKVGPGVDFRGQMPIPQDLYLKRGIQKPKTKGRKYSKPENKVDKEKICEKNENN